VVSDQNLESLKVSIKLSHVAISKRNQDKDIGNAYGAMSRETVG
jgi:hypothetical protein